MPKAVQFSIGLDNTAGTLARLCDLLRKARVNIDAICVSDNADCGWVRLIATPASRARATLAKAKLTVIAKLVVTAEAENEPGGLEKIAKKLSRAGVNVNYVYGSTVRGSNSVLVFGVDDVDGALRALGE